MFGALGTFSDRELTLVNLDLVDALDAKQLPPWHLSFSVKRSKCRGLALSGSPWSIGARQADVEDESACGFLMRAIAACRKVIFKRSDLFVLSASKLGSLLFFFFAQQGTNASVDPGGRYFQAERARSMVSPGVQWVEEAP